MSDDDAKAVRSLVDDMVDEYREDTLQRLSKVSAALDQLSTSANSHSDDLLGEIKRHSHSIKGTSTTFGLSGLSVIAHAMDGFLVEQNMESSPDFLRDLVNLNGLMVSVAEAESIVPHDVAEEMLSDLGLAAVVKTTCKKSTALLIMPQGHEKDAISRILNILGLDIVSAGDGVLAIELATSRQPDVILTALHSDRLNAPDLVQVFAEINSTASIPTIVVLPDTDTQVAQEYLDAATLMESRLPTSIHRLAQGPELNKSLPDKLQELGIIQR